jgi:polyisoprenoid-binding protein YceI
LHVSFFRPMLLAAALGVGVLGTARAADYTSLNTTDSRISFGYSQMNVNMDGSFGDLKATQFSFDPAKPEAARVTVEIPLASVDAGYGEANAEIQKREWLNVAEHPFARFESSKVEALGDNRYQVTGQLSIKGKAQEVTAPFTFKQEGGHGVFDGAFTFKRADFGIGEGMWGDFGIVANDIQIKFHVIANS